MKFKLLIIVTLLLNINKTLATVEDGYQAYQDGDYKLALSIWKKSAKKGDANAQYNIGMLHDFGKGIPENNKEAIKWYKKAAEQGYSAAQLNLAAMYNNGEGVPVSIDLASKYYLYAAKQDNELAQISLSDIRLKQNKFKESMVWAFRSLNNGYTEAQAFIDHLSTILSDKEKAGAKIEASLPISTPVGYMFTPPKLHKRQKQKTWTIKYWIGADTFDSDCQTALDFMDEGVIEKSRIRRGSTIKRSIFDYLGSCKRSKKRAFDRVNYQAVKWCYYRNQNLRFENLCSEWENHGEKYLQKIEKDYIYTLEKFQKLTNGYYKNELKDM